MAKQKPKAKVASTTKPKYAQSELKKIGMGYDKIGFKNSAVDMLKNKMSEHVTEWNDIVPESTMPRKPYMDQREFTYRNMPSDAGWPNNTMIDYSKRNDIIKQAYGPVSGELTGKKGVSKKAYEPWKNAMEAYRKDETLHSNVSSTSYRNSLRNKK